MANKLVYKDKIGTAGVMRFVKAIIFPFAALAVSMYSINLFGAYGLKLIAPLLSAIRFLLSDFVSEYTGHPVFPPKC